MKDLEAIATRHDMDLDQLLELIRDRMRTKVLKRASVSM